MAHGAACRMRYHGGLDVFNNPFLESLKKRHGIKTSNVHFFEVAYSGTSSATITEISIPNAEFDGSGTPAVLYLDSDSANDTLAGTGAQKVAVIGLTSADVFYVEVVDMGGLTAKVTTTLWKRVFHIFVYQCGTAGKAVGNIYCQDDAAGTNKYLKIAANQIESEGSRIWFPDGMKVQIEHLRANLTSFTVAEGSRVKVIATYNEYATATTEAVKTDEGLEVYPTQYGPDEDHSDDHEDSSDNDYHVMFRENKVSAIVAAVRMHVHVVAWV